MKRLEPKSKDVHVFVCHGKRCSDRGAPRLRAPLARALRAAGPRPALTRTTCQGRCKRGPVVSVERPKARLWGGVRERDVERLAAKLVRLVRGKAAGRKARDVGNER